MCEGRVVSAATLAPKAQRARTDGTPLPERGCPATARTRSVRGPAPSRGPPASRLLGTLPLFICGRASRRRSLVTSADDGGTDRGLPGSCFKDD